MNRLQQPIFARILSALAVLALLLVIAQSAAARAGLAPLRLFDWAARQQTQTFNPNFWVGGTVQLEYSVPGLYTDPLPRPDLGADIPSLGDIDVDIQLVKNGSSFSGYVNLGKTLIYPSLHTVDATAMGPSVTGSLSGSTLTLLSEQFETSLDGRIVKRQFQLKGTLSGSTFDGEYRETIWGYIPSAVPEPVTIVGSLKLSVAPAQAAGTLYLPMIRH